MTRDEFILNARMVHGDRYNYDGVNYVRSDQKVSIVCRVHGPFNQKPDHHLRKQGCRRCSGDDRRAAQTGSTEQFISEAKRKHRDDGYDYSRVRYFNRATKVIIGCPKHGWFEQSPGGHLRALGCKDCAAERASKANTYNTEDFVKNAVAVWGPRYSYSKTVYEGSRTVVTIICPTHGAFRQEARKHIDRVQGCKECSRAEKTATYNAKHKKIFLEQAQAIKDNKSRYNYDEFIYTGSHEEGNIYCNIHKEVFRQTPSNHRAGKGCPRCRVKGKYQSNYFVRYPDAKSVPAILYLLQFSFGSEIFLKMGITRNSVKQRYAYKRDTSPYELQSICNISGSLYELWVAEQKALSQFSEFAYQPGQASMRGNSECFCDSALPDLRVYLDRLATRLAGASYEKVDAEVSQIAKYTSGG